VSFFFAVAVVNDEPNHSRDHLKEIFQIQRGLELCRRFYLRQVRDLNHMACRADMWLRIARVICIIMTISAFLSKLFQSHVLLHSEQRLLQRLCHIAARFSGREIFHFTVGALQVIEVNKMRTLIMTI
jgi:hypothetical protein